MYKHYSIPYIRSRIELTFSIKDWDILVGEVVFTTGLCRRMLLFYAGKPSPSPLPTVQSFCLSCPVGLPVRAAPLEIRTRYQTCAPLELERQAFPSSSVSDRDTHRLAWSAVERLLLFNITAVVMATYFRIIRAPITDSDQKKCDPKTGRCVGSVCPCVFVSEDDRAFHHYCR